MPVLSIIFFNYFICLGFLASYSIYHYETILFVDYFVLLISPLHYKVHESRDFVLLGIDGSTLG